MARPPYTIRNGVPQSGRTPFAQKIKGKVITITAIKAPSNPILFQSNDNEDWYVFEMGFNDVQAINKTAIQIIADLIKDNYTSIHLEYEK